MSGLAIRTEVFNERPGTVATGWVSVHQQSVPKGAHLRALTDPNSVGIGMIVSDAPALVFCGSRLQLEELAVTLEGQLDLYALAAGTLIWVNFDRRLLDAVALERIANLPTGTLKSDRDAVHHLRAACMSLFVADAEATVSSGYRGASDAVVRALNDAVRDASARGLSKEALRRCDLVRRAEDYMWAHVEDAIDPAGIARALNCSVRKLLYYFKRTYDLGPIGYFKLQRLNAVRNVLSSDRTRRTIADIAADYGFWHMGHFGTAYRQLFGLTPSQTRALTRARFESGTGRRRSLAAESVVPSGSLRLSTNRFARLQRTVTVGCV